MCTSQRGHKRKQLWTLFSQNVLDDLEVQGEMIARLPQPMLDPKGSLRSLPQGELHGTSLPFSLGTRPFHPTLGRVAACQVFRGWTDPLVVKNQLENPRSGGRSPEMQGVH